MKDPDILRLEAIVPKVEAENAEFLLCELGSNSTLEKPHDDGKFVTVVAFFNSPEKSERLLKLEAAQAFKTFPGLRDADIRIQREHIADYTELCKQHFAPFEIARGIVVVPSWERYAPSTNESVINLDPGMAFGTGLHETTKLCAEAIESCARRASSMLDVGTGSGILAITARLLGVRDICAIENDPDALEVAKENFEKNSCSDILLAPRIEDAGLGFDLVAANILLSTLIELRDPILKRVAPHGTLVLSGITPDQEDEIKDAYGRNFKGSEVKRRGEWSAVIFRRG